MKYHESRSTVQSATVIGRYGLAVVAIALFCSCHAQGATPVVASDLLPFVCRVTNQTSGASNLGSGTLIDKTADSREGLVLTCAHLFRESVGEILVTFADGKNHRAALIDLDRQADLAALAIAYPTGQSAQVVSEGHSRGRLHACGYGPRGVYRCAVGSTVGQVASAGQMSLLISDSVRSGDSGGGVFDEQGRLVAVIWGEAQGVTYASYGKPLRQFLDRVLGRRTSVASSCPGGTCPQRLEVPPVVPGRGQEPSVATRWGDFQRQLDELRAQKQDRGDYLTRNELPDFSSYARQADVARVENESHTRYATLLQRLQMLSGRSVGRAMGTAVASLLGLSGPTGWAVVAAGSIGGWLVGRRLQRPLHSNKARGAGGRRRRRFPR